MPGSTFEPGFGLDTRYSEMRILVDGSCGSVVWTDTDLMVLFSKYWDFSRISMSNYTLTNKVLKCIIDHSIQHITGNGKKFVNCGDKYDSEMMRQWKL
jgi:hypothetical protein